jgi:4a-hydroxytetrahydrobiopterin dehydratase
MTDAEGVSQWVEEDGMLTQTFECEDYRGAIDLLNRIATIADDIGHHPDMLVYDYRFLSVMTCTHSENAITQKDYDLVSRIDAIV